MERNYTVWQWGLCYYRASVTFKRVWLVQSSFHPAVLSPVTCLVAHFKTNLPCHQLQKLQCVLAEQTMPRRHPWQWPPFQAGQNSYLPKRHCLIDSSASKQMYHISVWDAPASQELKTEHVFITPAKYSAMDDDCSLQQVWTCESLWGATQRKNMSLLGV